MRIPILPVWTKGLPDSTLIFSCDILEFFEYRPDSHGYKSVGVSDHLKNGRLPQPKKNDCTLERAKKGSKIHWLLGDLRELRRVMLEQEASK